MFQTLRTIVLLTLFAAVTASAANNLESVRVTNLLQTQTNWRRHNAKEQVDLSWSDEGELTIRTDRKRSRAIYRQRLPLRGASVNVVFQFDDETATDKNINGGMIFYGVLTEEGEPLMLQVDPEREVFSFGAVDKSFARLPENPYRYELDIQLGSDIATLYWGGRKIADIPVRYQVQDNTLGVFVSNGELAISSLSVRGGQHDGIPDNSDFQNVLINVSNTAARPLPSPWRDYWGTHYERVQGPDDPDPNIRYSAVRGYARMHLDQNREDSTAFQGPFTDQTVRVDLKDFHGKKTYRNPHPLDAYQLIPQLLRHNVIALQATPHDMDLAYHLLDQIYTQWPKAKGHIIWSTGNELVSPHYDPKELREQLEQNPPSDTVKSGFTFNGGYDLQHKLDYYVNHRLGPAAVAVEAVSRKHFGDPHAIPLALGSLNPYNQPNIWFLSQLMDSKFGIEAPESLRGDPIWKHCSHINVHYMFESDKERPRHYMDRYVQDYLRTGKVEGIWITEAHGRAGRGPVTILKTGFRFIDWVVDHQLTSQQTRMVWWGESTRAGGSGKEMMRQLGRFLTGLELSYVFYETDQARFYVLRDRKDEPQRVLVCVAPKQNPGQLDLGRLILKGLGSSNTWKAEAVQYSALTLPQAVPLQYESNSGVLQILLNRRITEPLVFWLTAGGDE